MEDATLFWKIAEGEHACPHASSLLGWEFILYEREKNQVRVRFHASKALTTPLECIQGGMLGAMLDDCMGSAVFAALGADDVGLVVRIETQLLRPAFPGHIAGVGKVTKKLKDRRYTSGMLLDEAGNLLATGKACYKIVRMPREGVMTPRS